MEVTIKLINGEEIVFNTGFSTQTLRPSNIGNYVFYSIVTGDMHREIPATAIVCIEYRRK